MELTIEEKAQKWDQLMAVFGPVITAMTGAQQPAQERPQTMNLTEAQRFYGKSYEWFVGRAGTRTRKGREGFLNHYRQELENWAVGYPAEGQTGYMIYAEHFSEFMEKHGTERY
ncbi:hypothetical protein [Lacticaseibacillus hulanensis]|uniref:hypothetical protein n=1 Tax=Lacticaseibacillus hulanensis TaxID=2493111 RepID=UPI000FDB7AE7|nr:hypothetical protein [Lacticaseibacillus hulanensis]